MRERKIEEALDAAREYYEATTAAFNSPRVQHTKKRLASALAALDKKEAPLSRRLEKRFTTAQADGAGE